MLLFAKVLSDFLKWSRKSFVARSWNFLQFKLKRFWTGFHDLEMDFREKWILYRWETCENGWSKLRSTQQHQGDPAFSRWYYCNYGHGLEVFKHYHEEEGGGNVDGIGVGVGVKEHYHSNAQVDKWTIFWTVRAKNQNTKGWSRFSDFQQLTIELDLKKYMESRANIKLVGNEILSPAFCYAVACSMYPFYEKLEIELSSSEVHIMFVNPLKQMEDVFLNFQEMIRLTSDGFDVVSKSSTNVLCK